jgi:hypothetical protein
MPRVRFELTTPVFEMKAFHALDRVATVIGTKAFFQKVLLALLLSSLHLAGM